jgi:hypothetical protein
VSTKILHISLTQQGNDYVSLRYFWDNPNDYQENRLPLTEIEGLKDRADTDYYTRLPEDYAKTGQTLFNWLDKSDRILANALNQDRQNELILAISTDKGLAHLPWELLHDGESFFVEKRPPILPLRWLSKGQQKPIVLAKSPQNRPLNLLFMATSPLGVDPVLDYEAEEGQILEATKRTPVDLRVEESGWLEELGYVAGGYESGHLDVFHLTGHATHQEGKPCFLTEGEYGNCVYSHSEDIVDTLGFPLPPLIFLCGCRTGKSDDGDVLSMSEELLNMGATSVLGWGERVLDTDAALASSQFYGELSQGKPITQALASTYQTLIKQQARDWHKLRFYVANTLPGSLVTPLRTPKRKPLPKPTTSQDFRDDEKRLRVSKREEFVGRRRQLQNCIRTLKTDDDKVGVLIHGMGGWGKSSIASRLWDRLSDYQKILWWRQIDEPSLIRKFKDKLISPATRELIADLENYQLDLKSRFSYLFSQLAELGEKPFLMILDDFEWNLEPRVGQYILKSEVATVLRALVEAIQESETQHKHRIIITCRYEFNSDLSDFFFSQGLEPLKKAELTKKLSRLEHFSSGKLSEDLRNKALSLADGNPRLLEFLNNEVLGQNDVEAKLKELEQSPELWKEKIIWEGLYQLIDEPLQKALSCCLVYETPVPMPALEAVCESFPNYKQQLQRGLNLGLIEISSEIEEESRNYRVSRIITHIIPNIRLPEAPKVYSLYRNAHKKLHELWQDSSTQSEVNWREIFRLLFADKENLERFREGFSLMLAVASNESAASALESIMRQSKDELLEENFFNRLQNYLCQGDWKQADEETTWIFYLVMILQGYAHRFQLFREFPHEILNKIDRLWVDESQGRFGFSTQLRIWKSVGGKRNPDSGVFEKFLEQIGWYQWYQDDSQIMHNLIPFSIEAPVGNLPAYYAHPNHYRGQEEIQFWNDWQATGAIMSDLFDYLDKSLKGAIEDQTL